MPQGFAVEDTQTIHVLAAWTVPKSVVSGVAEAPGWVVLGEYYLPKSCAARLDVVHLVSDDGLTSTVRLWDTTLNAAVAGSTTTTSRAPVRTTGAVAQLVGGRTYQVQAECVGAAGDDQFSVIEAATITD